jgi:superfamily II DNA/RNA helicase
MRAGLVEQSVQLQNRPHVVIATPGRLAEHINTSVQTMHLQKYAHTVWIAF